MSPKLLLHVDAQFVSPYAMAAFVALHEKGLPFQISTIDLAGRANHEPKFATTSLTRRVIKAKTIGNITMMANKVSQPIHILVFRVDLA